jgi:hypothetical protein
MLQLLVPCRQAGVLGNRAILKILLAVLRSVAAGQ